MVGIEVMPQPDRCQMLSARQTGVAMCAKWMWAGMSMLIIGYYAA